MTSAGRSQATKLTDRDGDVWVQNADGTWRHEEDSSPGFLDSWKREAIERMFGPLTVTN